MPPCAVRPQAVGERLSDLGVGERFGTAIIPSEAGEHGEITCNILLEIHAESVLHGDVQTMVRDVGGGAGGSGLVHLVGVETTVGKVSVAKQANAAGLVWNYPMPPLEFVVFGMDLPGLPD